MGRKLVERAVGRELEERDWMKRTVGRELWGELEEGNCGKGIGGRERQEGNWRKGTVGRELEEGKIHDSNSAAESNFWKP